MSDFNDFPIEFWCELIVASQPYQMMRSYIDILYGIQHVLQSLSPLQPADR